jgi:hypothetical protein
MNRARSIQRKCGRRCDVRCCRTLSLALGKDGAPGSCGSAQRCHYRHPNLVRTTPPLHPDMIFGKDRSAQAYVRKFDSPHFLAMRSAPNPNATLLFCDVLELDHVKCANRQITEVCPNVGLNLTSPETFERFVPLRTRSSIGGVLSPGDGRQGIRRHSGAPAAWRPTALGIRLVCCAGLQLRTKQ